MLKTACFLTGDNYTIVNSDTPSSKKKVVAMSIAMLVPILLWVLNGFMLSNEVLKAGFFGSVITGLVCGIIVFLIEKLIIMANGNGWLTFFRVCIGIIVALLGSIAIDEVVFKNDIDISVAAIKESAILDARRNKELQFLQEHNYSGIEKKTNEAQRNYDITEASTLAEADGTNGSKTRGMGTIAKLKNEKLLNRKTVLNSLTADKSQLDLKKTDAVDKAELVASNSFKENALLIRIKGLFQLAKSDSYMLVIYILFTLLLFFFEFLVVILKLTWKKTNYERKLEMIEKIGQTRIEFLLKSESPLSDPGNYIPQLELARNRINAKTTLFK